MNSSAQTGSNISNIGETEWLTGTDGSKHFLRFWSAQFPRAFVLYLHGIEGHSLWFQDTANFLREQGITTLALDRRGSGMSNEPRGDLKNWKELLDDTSLALSYAQKKAAGVPLFLMANCWGAKIAALLAENNSAESKLIDGLILSSPAIEVKVDLPLSQKLLIAWRLLVCSNAALSIPLEVKDFTDNPPYLSFISEDKLRLTQASPRFFLNTLILTMMSKKSAEKISLPTLLVQSGIDSIVDQTGVTNWFSKIKTSDKKMQIFPDAFHSLDFHSKPEPYRELLATWILSHSIKSGSKDPS